MDKWHLGKKKRKVLHVYQICILHIFFYILCVFSFMLTCVFVFVLVIIIYRNIQRL